MAKEFYTEKDVEDMSKAGIMSLEVTDDVVLTELAYEKARKVGMNLVRERPDNPPSAPVRPYIAQKQCRCASVPESHTTSAPAETKNVQQRIREAVISRLGAQIDTNLLDVIIKRVLANTGVK